MGMQIGFYMNPDDESDFADMLQAMEAVFCLPSPRTASDMEVPQLPLIVSKPPRDIIYYIRPLPSESDLVIDTFRSGVMSVNIDKSMVIEMQRSCIVEGICYPGRLWYQSPAISDQDKASDFRTAASTIFRWLRHNYQPVGLVRRRTYIGPQTFAASQAGELTIA